MKEVTFSQTAVESVLRDIRTGNDADYVASFFANRPEWLDQDDQASPQANDQEVQPVKAAQA